MTTTASLSAIVLCGGRSSRMGRDKASLPIGENTFLQHTCKIAAHLATPIVVVAAADQHVAKLDPNVVVVRDETAYPGPLPALQRGFETLLAEIPNNRVAPTSVWVTGCDTPFVTHEIIASLWKHQREQSANVATLTQDGRDNPLLAVYEFTALRKLQPFMETGQFRATDFLNSLDVARQPVEEIPRDKNTPAATSNLNTEDDFHRAFGSGHRRQNR